MSGGVQERPLHRVPRPWNLQLLRKRLQLLACHDRAERDVQVSGSGPSPSVAFFFLQSAVIHTRDQCRVPETVLQQSLGTVLLPHVGVNP